MKRFVLCDDDCALTAMLARLLHTLYGNQIHIRTLCTGAELIAFFAARREADVLLLDIELGEVNGIDLVQQHLSPDSNLQIIYLTGYSAYCTDVYKTRHVSFLLKPIQTAQLKKAIDAAFSTLETLHANSIPLRSGSMVRMLQAEQVLYLESVKKSVYITTTMGQLEIPGKLSDLLSQLDARFLRCHQSFAINMERIKSYDGSAFLMEDNQLIQVSKLKRKEVRVQFMSYVEGIPWTQV